MRVVARKPLHLLPVVVVIAQLFPVGEKRHGVPAVWLGAKRTYPICPILRRRYLAALSFSRSKNKVLLSMQAERGNARIYSQSNL